jgi:hypothetical protein
MKMITSHLSEPQEPPKSNDSLLPLMDNFVSLSVAPVATTIPRLGITLEGIKQFMSLCQAMPHGKRLETCTTEEVKTHFLLQLTALSRGSFCSQLDEQRSSCVGPATHFVSHSWRYRFLDVVAALENFSARASTPPGAPGRPGGSGGEIIAASGGRGTKRSGGSSGGEGSAAGALQSQGTIFFWFDIFSNSQHDTAEKDFEWWVQVFKKNVLQIGHTLLVLQWDNPIPLSRAWCIWEIFCSVNADSTTGRRAVLEVIMPPQDEDSLVSALSTRFEEVVEKLSTVDIIDAQASVEEDKNRIFAAISETLGVDEINRCVSEELRAWLLSTSLAVLNKIAPEVQRLSSPLCINVSRLQWTLAFNNEARLSSLALARQAVKACTAMRHANDPVAIDAHENLAFLLYMRGKFWGSDIQNLEDARSMYKDIVEQRSANVGSCEEDLKVLLDSQGGGKGGEEEAKALRARLVALERSRVNALTWYGAAVCYTGDRRLGEKILRDALRSWKALGEDNTNLNAFWCKIRLSELLITQLYTYCKVCSFAYPTYLRVSHILHERHPEVLNVARWITQGLYHTRDFVNASALAREILRLMTNQLGREHPYTRIVLKNHVFGLLKGGMFIEAEPCVLELMRLCLEEDGGCTNWANFLDYGLFTIYQGCTLALFTTPLGLAGLFSSVFAFNRLCSLLVISQAVRFLFTGIFSSAAQPSRLILPSLACALMSLASGLLFVAPLLPLLHRVPVGGRFFAFLQLPLLGIALGGLLSIPIQIALSLVEYPLSALLELCLPSWDPSRMLEPLTVAAVDARLRAVRASRIASSESAARSKRLSSLGKVALLSAETVLEAIAAAHADLLATVGSRDICPSLKEDLKFVISALVVAGEGGYMTASENRQVLLAACTTLDLCSWQTTVADAPASMGAVRPLLAALAIPAYMADLQVCRIVLSVLRNLALASSTVREVMFREGSVATVHAALRLNLNDPLVCEHAAWFSIGMAFMSEKREFALLLMVGDFVRALHLHMGSLATTAALVKSMRYFVYSNNCSIEVLREAGCVAAVVLALERYPADEDIIRQSMGMFWGVAFRSDSGRDEIVASGALPLIARCIQNYGPRGMSMIVSLLPSSPTLS